MELQLEGLKCRYEMCNNVCRSKVDQVRHEKRMHWVNEERVRFECGLIERMFQS